MIASSRLISQTIYHIFFYEWGSFLSRSTPFICFVGLGFWHMNVCIFILCLHNLKIWQALLQNSTEAMKESRVLENLSAVCVFLFDLLLSLKKNSCLSQIVSHMFRFFFFLKEERLHFPVIERDHSIEMYVDLIHTAV